jgi:hypothetical protein
VDYLCQLKGIHALTGFRFLVAGTNLLPNIKRFHLIFNDLRPALWALEICTLIANDPKFLYPILQKGNYNPLSKLAGEFYFFSSEFDFYVQLGCWMAYFHNMNGEFFSKDHITIVIKNYNRMVFVSDDMLPQSIVKALSELQQAMERGEVATFLSAASLKALRIAIEGRKSLTEMGCGALELFSEFLPRQNLSRLGLIRECQLNMHLLDSLAHNIS